MGNSLFFNKFRTNLGLLMACLLRYGARA